MRARLHDLPLLVVLMGAVSAMCWLPAAHAASQSDHDVAQAFFYSGLMLMVLTAMLGIATVHSPPRRPARAQLAALIGAYLVLPFAMAFPLLQALPGTGLLDAWFEMLSCFTTTGASVFEPGRLPPSVHLWRAMMGWFGGFFILLAAIAILAPLNLGGAEMIRGRATPVSGRTGAGSRGQSGGQTGGPVATGAGPAAAGAEGASRLWRITGIILPIYAGLTFVLWLGLLIAGEDGLLALTHAMGTLSTSGITAGIGLSVTGSGLAGEVLILVFLMLALSRRLMPLPGTSPQDRPLVRDPELRLSLFLVAVVVAVLVLRHLMSDVPSAETSTVVGLARAIWGATFTAVSFLTTTGYESAWWSSARDWAGMGAPGLLLLGLTLVGGGVLTTAGGVKLLRVHALLIHGEHELDRIIHPSAVGGKGAEARHLRGPGAYMAWVFFTLFAMSIALVVGALTLAGLTFEPALVLAIAALTTTGPVASVATAEPIAYEFLSGPVKVILGLAMVVGRVETLALVALLAPGNWRR